MNDKQLEAAARLLCEARGVNPEDKVCTSPDPNPDGSVNLVAIITPCWRIAAREIRNHWCIEQAIAEALKP